MSESPAPTNDHRPVWEYVAPGEHRVPAAPVEQTLRTGFSTFWRQLRPVAAPVDQPLIREDVEALSDKRLAAVAPEPGWVEAAAALDLALGSWLERSAEAPHAVVTLGHPHGGHDAVLRAWAAHRAWRLVRDPETHEVLGSHEDWFNELSGDGTPWVLPELQRCFLRHVHGLSMVRALLARIGRGEFGRGVIGCDSWSWAFLRHQWQGQGLPVLIAQAFDAERLATWLAGLAATSGRPLVFRQSDNGRYLWPPADTASVPLSDFVRKLSIHSRGIPGVAWATWRRSLVGTARDPRRVGTQGGSTTVLVRPWGDLRDLIVPADAPHDAGLVLHALLVHSGLPLTLLPLVTPLPEDEIAAVVSRLEAAELITSAGDRYQVSALGYPSVRQLVASRGFVTD